MEMVAHCLAGLPDEACGLLVGSYGGDEATQLFATANAAASAMVYEIDPKEMLRVDRAAQDLGADIMGVFHSHTHNRRLSLADRRGQGVRSRLALRARLAAGHPPRRS